MSGKVKIRNCFMKLNLYRFKVKVWLYPGMAAWHFVTLPKKESDEIKAIYGGMKKGFGSLPVVVSIGKTIRKIKIKLYDLSLRSSLI